ncbi:MAG: LytTr DNA-binding domain family [Anaerocolumna sp.]|nr:LytTr DNA-binding domain family [Anaerocolumna sp.]
MFHIAICDDQQIICSEIERVILNYTKDNLNEIVVDIYYTGEELCRFMKSGEEFDLIFLDIELRNINGVEVGKIIRDEMKNDLVQIVYISGKDNYYLELFEVRPMHFLHKPLKPDKIIKDIEKAMELSGRLNNFYTYKQNHKVCKLPIKDILYFESDNRRVKIITAVSEIYFYGSLEEVFREVSKYRFLYIHKSYIVNYTHITRFGHKEIVVTNNTILPISQQRRKQILEQQLVYEREVM